MTKAKMIGVTLVFVFTPRNSIIAKLSIHKPGYSSTSDIISTDKDPGLRIGSFAIIKLRGVSYKLQIILFPPCKLSKNYHYCLLE